ncbi:MAG: tetratricopeptide repeat protein [Candidatus Dormibacteraeota bacterium]|nr:tetratricopeptide repeat protein [Candidatus Dormibacteraeota bacterium]
MSGPPGPAPADALLERARELNAVGRPEEAADCLRRVLAEDPESVEAHCLLAIALHRLHRPEEGVRQAEAAAAMAPDDEWPHRIRSVCLSDLGRYREAADAAAAAVRLAPQLGVGWRTLAEARVDAGFPREAWEAASRAVELEPGVGASHEVIGRVALTQRDWPLAERALRSALAIEPLSPSAHNNLGVALQAQRRWKEALDEYQEAARLNPADPTARGNVVRVVRPNFNRWLLGAQIVLAIARPLNLPFLIGSLITQLAQSRRRRSYLRPGARLYYDRETRRRSRWRPRFLLVGVALWLFGAVVLEIAVGLGQGWALGPEAFITLSLGALLVVAWPLRERLARRRRRGG